MQTNMGTTDRIIRAIVGVAALIGSLALGLSSLGASCCSSSAAS